jgi:hypothetical protein
MGMLFPWYLVRENAVSTNDFKVFREEVLIDIVQRHSEQRALFDTQQKKCVVLLEDYWSSKKSNEILDLKRRVLKGKEINISKIQLKLELFEELSKYNVLLEEVMNLYEQYVTLYGVKEQEGRKKLQEIIRTSVKVLNPLPLLNRNFHYKLTKFLNESTVNHKAKTRKLDFQLSRVLSRATLKTSPFSSFTSISLRKWGELPSYRRKYSVNINFYIIQKIIDILNKEPDLKECSDYRISEYVKKGNQYAFNVRVDANKGKIFNNIEHSILLHVNILLDTLTDMFKEASCIPYHKLKRTLMTYLDDVQCEKFLDALISKNILFSNTAVDEFTYSPEEDYLNKLTLYAKKSQKAKDVLFYYTELQSLLLAFENTEGLKRFEINNRITETLMKLEGSLGVEFQKDLVFYEDYIDDGIIVHPRFEMVFKKETKNINILQKLAVMSSLSLIIRLEFAYLFKEKYGAQPVSTSDNAVYDIYERVMQKINVWTDMLAPIDGLASPLAKEVESYRRTIKELFIQAKQDVPEVQLDTTKIEALYREYEARIKIQPAPSTILFQIQDDEIVLNKMYTGKLRLFVRFFHHYDGIYDDPDFLAYVDTIFSKNGVEIAEGFGFNANHHQKFIENRLILGNSREVNVNNNEEILLNHLFFKLDPDTNIVCLYNQAGEKIESVDIIGSLVDFLLPYSIQMLNSNITPTFDIDSIKMWDDNSSNNNTDLIVEYIPRLKVGDIVISRKKWLLNVAQLRSKNGTEERAFELTQLFLKDKLPTEFFIKKHMVEDEARDYVSMRRTAFKPQYVNIRMPLYVKQFLKIIDQNNYVVLEEVYPAIEGYRKNLEYQVEYGGIEIDI